MTTQLPPSAASQVLEFHETYGCAINVGLGDPALRNLRWELISEEANELYEAIQNVDEVEVADALGDLIYVIYGTAISFGIDLDAVVAEIHRSNMSKLGEDGKPIYREDGKVLKGPNYFKPDILGVLNV